MTSTGEIDRLVSRVAAPIASSALARCAPGSFPKRMRRDLEDLAGMLADLAPPNLHVSGTIWDGLGRRGAGASDSSSGS